MTNVLGQSRRPAGQQLPTLSPGWLIGSYPTYAAKAQQAVEVFSPQSSPSKTSGVAPASEARTW